MAGLPVPDHEADPEPLPRHRQMGEWEHGEPDVVPRETDVDAVLHGRRDDLVPDRQPHDAGHDEAHTDDERPLLDVSLQRR
jgi:hypothetical protein